MLNTDRVSGSPLLGEPDFVAIERGIVEFRAARPVAITAGRTTLLVLPVDGLDDRRLAAFRAAGGNAQPVLVLTARRAQTLGIEAAGPVSLTLSATDDAASIRAAATDVRIDRRFSWAASVPAAAAALPLAKLAHRLPAALCVEIDAGVPAAFNPPVVHIGAGAIAQFRERAIRSLAVASEASVPLSGDIQARFVVFRGMMGGEQAAIIVNEPDFSKPITVRLHSACLTGDVFGSRRCDCGDQLRLAMKQLAAAGGGIVLYLDQEGRGVGLANKMRTYRLQDGGLDTVDANIVLGFDDDERDYGIAGRMLEMLGCRQVVLMTNNPAKVDGLSDAGIEITGRIPLLTPVNGDNRRYLAAKAMRAGHSLDHLFDALAASEPTIVPDETEAAS